MMESSPIPAHHHSQQQRHRGATGQVQKERAEGQWKNKFGADEVQDHEKRYIMPRYILSGVNDYNMEDSCSQRCRESKAMIFFNNWVFITNLSRVSLFFRISFSH